VQRWVLLIMVESRDARCNTREVVVCAWSTALAVWVPVLGVPTGLRSRNLDVKALQAVFELLQSHYPERLHGLYFLNAPFIFWGVWKLVRSSSAHCAPPDLSGSTNPIILLPLHARHAALVHFCMCVAGCTWESFGHPCHFLRGCYNFI